MARRVTFHSQQSRAFNLVWALFESGKLREGMSVGIVGGGLAGITAAAAATLKGCTVVLLESNDRELHLQRQNTTRSVYPFIYFWPAEGSVEPETDLPCMNWHGGTTEVVVNQLLDQWRTFREQRSLTVHLGFEVNRVLIVNGRPRVAGNMKTGGWNTFNFDCLILAVGFGKERFIGKGGTKSYWQIDAHHQGDIGHDGIKKILISGCGDGGLIDVVRFRLADFSHSLLLSDIFHGNGIEAIAPKLMDIDQKARSLLGQDVSAFLYDEYSKLDVPVAVIAALSARLRTDTHVTLNGRETTPLSLDASILNRLAVFLLIQVGRLDYLQGELDPDRIAITGTGYNVAVKSPSGTEETFACHEVIIRHGPESVITKLLSEADADHLKRLSFADSDRTMQRSWPADFYPNTGLCARASPLTLLGPEIARAARTSNAIASLIRVTIPADLATISNRTGTSHSTSYTSPPTSTPDIVNDEKASQFEKNIIKYVQTRQYQLASLESAAAVTWLLANEATIQADGVRSLYFAVAKETLNRSMRETDPAAALELRMLAQDYFAKAKGTA